MAIFYVGDKNPDGTAMGRSASDKVSFYGVAPIVQRSGAAQGAVSTTNATTTTPWGFATSTQANAISAAVAEIQATLTALGLWKGAA